MPHHPSTLLLETDPIPISQLLLALCNALSITFKVMYDPDSWFKMYSLKSLEVVHQSNKTFLEILTFLLTKLTLPKSLTKAHFYYIFLAFLVITNRSLKT